MRVELSKAKKALREKERELAKMRQEIANQKKAAMENNSFTTKDATPNNKNDSE